MFQRNHIKFLEKWKNSPHHKPLVLRGARQVGKTSLIRDFASQFFDQLIEINLDHPDNQPLAQAFETTSPKNLIPILEVHFKTRIIPGKTLLFLDEIQAAPKAFAMLRYFYEDQPDLHVISAGSLLDFILKDHEFSMPVGRIEYMYLSPMSFEEFLSALGEKPLLDFIQSFGLPHTIPPPFHEQLLALIKLYLVLGGMPEVIQRYDESKDLNACFQIQKNILATYEDDFHKYQKRINYDRIKKVFLRLPNLVGQKLKYVHLDPSEQSKPLSQTLDLLCRARVCYRIYHSSCQGIPLKVGVNEKVFKILFLDVGLMSQSCGLSFLDVQQAKDLSLLNQGRVTEQFIGQHLLYAHPPYQEPELFYWSREKRNASSEVDYVFSVDQRIIPVEVKSGKTGRLRSLHTFVAEHDVPCAVRFNSDLPSFYTTKTALPQTNANLRLLSLPFYLVEQVKRLVHFI